MTERELFIAALQQDTTERPAFLDRACPDDPALRQRVGMLLQAHVMAGGLLDLPGVHPPTRAGASPTATAEREAPDRPGPADEVGSRVGPYKLLQTIGEGGMGVVFLAEQEEPVRRKVALKIIRPGMDSHQVVARFEAERQALALMDHPNIARVLDAGTTPLGRPYFVMELVHGVPITEYCDKARLNPVDRLRLFVPVCQALQHAHQKGVIHRDVKPSNVLVTVVDGRPVPKVIDFGVAKAVDQRLTEKTLFTHFGAVVGTLEYMSPEQAEFGGHDVDTRTDVYALGVLLYELLTGTTPLERARLREAGYAEVLRRIREDEPPTPSTRLSASGDRLASIAATRNTEPNRLARAVRGDLDWIVMKALEKDRTRRYESASGLAKDVGRFLDGDAVEAGRPGAWYRLRKAARRHRAGLTTAAAVGLGLLLAAVCGLFLAVIEQRAALAARQQAVMAHFERTRAEEAQRREKERFALALEAARAFHDGVSEDPALLEPGQKELRDRLLRQASEFYARLRKVLEGDPDPTARAALAQAYEELGRLDLSLGRDADAVAALDQAVALRRELLGQPGDAAARDLDLARVLVLAGRAREKVGQPAGALAHAEEAELRARPAASAGPHAEAARNLLALARAARADALAAAGRDDEAVKEAADALESFQQQVKSHPDDTRALTELAGAGAALARALMRTGRDADAARAYDQTVAAMKELVRTHPNVAAHRLALARVLGQSAMALGQTGRTADAESAYRQALELAKALVEEVPQDVDRLSAFARLQTGLARLLLDAGRPAEAEASLAAATVVFERLAQQSPENRGYRDDLAEAATRAAEANLASGRPDEATARARRAIALREAVLAASPDATAARLGLAETLLVLGRAQSAAGREADAVSTYRRAVELSEASETTDGRILTAAALASLARSAGRPDSGLKPDAARDLLDRAAAALRRASESGAARVETRLRRDPVFAPLRPRFDLPPAPAAGDRKPDR